MTIRSLVAAWRNRALPISIASLQGVKCVSYSQFGEDALLNALLGNQYPAGFYVDVGCFHPIKWSNTYALYLQRWRGICIDPNEGFTPLWRKWRPRDEYVNIGISDTESSVPYIRNIKIPQENYLRTAKNELRTHGGEAVLVPVRRLDAVLGERLRAGQQIDVMSIDCEGYDLAVLRSNDFSNFRPRVLVVEDMKPLGESEICTFCETEGYRLSGTCGPSRVFVDNAWKRSEKNVS